MGWGWLKPVLEFFRALFGDLLTAEKKGTDAQTTDETKERFQAGLGARIKPEPPADK